MSVASDILGINKSRGSQIESVHAALLSNSAFTSTRNRKPQKNREISNLLEENKTPDQPSEPVRESHRVSWKRVFFQNSARSDNAIFKLKHWENHSAEDYAAATNILTIQIPASKKLKGWSLANTDRMLDLADRTELRFPVISDRIGVPVPECKAAYFELLDFRYDIDTERSRRDFMESEESRDMNTEKVDTSKIKSLQSVAREIKDLNSVVEKALAFSNGPKKSASNIAFLASEDKTITRKKYSCVSQISKSLDLEIVSLLEEEKQLKAALKAVQVAK
jgi:hypothetical protein